MAEEPWQVAPPLTEESYTLADALVVGTMLITLLKHADRIRIACIAQLVNAIAPIMTVTGGGVWKQTTYYPYLHAANYGRGTALNVIVDSPRYADATFDGVPLLECTATRDEVTGQFTIFAVNRSQTDSLALDGDLRSFPGLLVVEHLVLEHADPDAGNSVDRPDEAVPHAGGDARLDGGRLSATLPGLSWNVIRLKTMAAAQL
jgi:alpha-N-arabinofuranosidase